MDIAITNEKTAVNHSEIGSEIYCSYARLNKETVFARYFDHLDKISGQLLKAIEHSRVIISQGERK